MLVVWQTCEILNCSSIINLAVAVVSWDVLRKGGMINHYTGERNQQQFLVSNCEDNVDVQIEMDLRSLLLSLYIFSYSKRDLCCWQTFAVKPEVGALLLGYLLHNPSTTVQACHLFSHLWEFSHPTSISSIYELPLWIFSSTHMTISL